MKPVRHGIAVAAAAFALLAGCATPPSTTPTAAPLKAVDRVDLDRYVGTWHEIARYPFGIQDRRCARDTTASYTALAADRLAVVNRCLQADGTPFAAEATAWVLDRRSNARLQVSFLPRAIRWLPLGRGDYWVIELDRDYQWVVVGEPRRRYLWILARTPDLPAAQYAEIIARLPQHGYDPARLRRSPGR